MISNAKYECDFCKSQVESICNYNFDAAWDRSSHTVHHKFELCNECHNKVRGKSFVIKMLINFFKIGIKK